MKKILLTMAVGVLVLIANVSAQYAFNSADFIANNDAYFNGNQEFVLTQNLGGQSGSVWYQNKLDLSTGFDLKFSVYLGSNGGGADGIAFVLQPLSTGQGSAGGGLGYLGISPSLAIEMDTYYNSPNYDLSNDHIALMKDGSVVHSGSNNLVGPNNVGELEDGVYHSFRVVWNATSQTLSAYLDGALEINYSSDIVNTVFSGDPGVYFGLTGATGGATNLQKFKVESLYFVEEFAIKGAQVTPAECIDSQDGSINLNVVPENGNVTYSWSNGATTQDLNNVNPGTFTVVIQHVDGRSLQQTYTVGQVDDSPPLALAKDISVELGTSGEVTISPVEVDNGSNDLCGIVSYELSKSTFTCEDYGANQVELTVKDAAGNAASALATVTITGVDSDGDGYADVCDLDDDNDGILDANECTSSNFFWSNPPSVSGKTASGTINGIPYTYTSSVNITTTTNMFAHSVFPTEYNVPNDNPTIQNLYVSENTLSFSSPMTNPILVFSSIGQPSLAVTIKFSEDIQILWSTAVVKDASDQITGNEGYAIIRLNGTYSTISFDYLDDETYVNFAFGADFYDNCDTDSDGIADYLDPDSDNDGCYDAIEGSLGFSPDQAPNGALSGGVDQNGVPVLAGELGQEAGTSANASANCFCELGIDETDPIALAKDVTVYLDASGNATIAPEDVDKGSSDNCGTVELSLDDNAFDCSDLGARNVATIVSDNTWSQSTVELVTPSQYVSVLSQLPDVSTYTLSASNAWPYGTVNFFSPAIPDAQPIYANGGTKFYRNEFELTGRPQSLRIRARVDNIMEIFVNGVSIGVEDDIDGANFSNSIYHDVFIDDNGVQNGYNGGMQFDAVTSQSILDLLHAGSNELIFAIANTNGTDQGGFMVRMDAVADGVPVELTVSDPNGNSSTATAFVVVKDELAPEITTTPIEVTLGAGGTVSINAVDVASAVDNCGVESLVLSQYVFDATNAQNSPVSVEVTSTDVNGNVSTAQVEVTVVDPVPTALCKDIVVALDADGTVSITAQDVDNGSSSLVGLSGMSVAPSSFSCDDLGANTVTLTVTSTLGKTASCEATVTVIDDIDPVALAQDVTVTLDVFGQAQITVADVDNGSYDNCEIVSLTVSQQDFSCNDEGDNTVTLSATDASGNIGSALATVTVLPTPVPEASDDYFVAEGCQSFQFTAADLLANDSDPMGQNLKVDFVAQPSTGTIVDHNDGTYTYTPSVNTDHTLTVEYTIKRDDGTTVFTGNGHYYEFVEALGITWTDAKVAAENSTYQGRQGYLATITSLEENGFAAAKLNGSGWIGASDSGSEGIWKWVTGPEDGAHFSNQYTNWWSNCSASTASGINGYYANWYPGEPNDCGVSENYAHFYSSGLWNDYPHDAGNNIAGYVVEYGGLDDDCDVEATAQASLTIEVKDNVAPVAVAQNVTVQLDENGLASVSVSQVDNGSSDNCEIAEIILSQTAFDCSNIGENEVVLTVTDVNGNVSAANAVVTVEDNIAPTVVCSGDILSYDTSVPTDSYSFYIPAGGQTYGWAPWIYEFNDPLPAGATVVGADLTFTAVDQGWGNTGANANMYVSDTYIGSGQLLHHSQTHSITYEGAVPGYVYGGNNTLKLYHVGWPGWVAYWQGGTLTLHYKTSDDCMASVTVQSPLTSDNCSVVSVVNDYNGTADASGSYPIGDTEVTWTITDVAGNVSSCQQTISVIDNTPPDVLVNNITVALDQNGFVEIYPEEIDGGSTDNCEIESVVIDVNTFECSNVGDNDVVLTVTDIHGNVASAVAIVTVEDNVAPEAIAQAVTVQLDAGGIGSITPELIDDGSNDACGIANLALDVTDFSCADVGSNEVVLTVTDNNGNVSTATAVVTVEDNVAPVAITQPVTVQLNAEGNGSITPELVDAGSNDACGIASLALDVTDFSCSDVGANTVTLTVTDNNGNVSTATATVTVEDNVAPVAIAQPLTVELDADGLGSITPLMVDNGSNDACGIATYELDITDFSCADVGANEVVLTVTDVNGNVSAANALITVEDNVAPVVLTVDVTVSLDDDGNGSIAVSDIDNGSNDACGIASLVLSQTNFDCSHVGENTVTLTATDVNGNVASATAVVTVVDLVPPVAVCQHVTIHLDAIGQAFITAEDIDGGSTDACGIASLEASQTDYDCSDVGDNNITLTVTDVNGNVSTCVAVVTVINDVPEINSVSVTDVVDLAETVYAEAVYTDVNLVDVQWDWGNGDVTTGTVDAGSGMVYGEYSYPETGIYDVTVTITDICGETDTETYSYVVIFDPCAGHVTGGGYLLNSEGKKNNFGFNAKYDPETLQPKGMINFHEKVEGIHFKSEQVDWLMVNTEQAVYSGTGTINDVGSYKYVVSIVDGEIVGPNDDYFRIIIYDAGTVIYDTQWGAYVGALADRLIDNGEIKIHKGCAGDEKETVADTGSDDSGSDDDAADAGGNDKGNDKGSKSKGKGKGKGMKSIKASAEVYPNPVQNIMHVRFTDLEDQRITYQISDVNGKVYSFEQSTEVVGSKTQIDVSRYNLKQGNYMIILRNANDSYVESKMFLKR